MKALLVSVVAGVLASGVIYLVMGTGRDKIRGRGSAGKESDTPKEKEGEVKQASDKTPERVIPTREWTGRKQ